MKTVGALLWEPGTRSGWSVEEIELDPPKRREVMVKLAASGICHSDDHLDTGDIPLGWAPILGGHEGAGVVTEVGPEVTDLQEGDHVVLSFLPSCGKCRMCVAGRANMCELGSGVLGGFAPDGTHRIHARGKGVGPMSYLGTFAPYATVPVDAVVKIDPEIPLLPASLIGCGVPTGWGSAVHAAGVRAGDTVVVFGAGGVGSNAVQGARFAGAQRVVVVDPVHYKREMATVFGATHTFATAGEAVEFVNEVTWGELADHAIITVGVLHDEVIADALKIVGKSGQVTVTAVGNGWIDEHPGMLIGYERRIQGAIFGACNPLFDVPRLLSLYRTGDLKLDELITRTYKLDEVNQGYQDMLDGKNIRGVIIHEH